MDSHLSRTVSPLRIQMSGRLVGMGIVFLLMCIGLIARLAFLQVVQHDTFLKRSEGNRLRIVPISASRGNLYDRKNRLLAGTRLSYSVTLHPTQLDKAQADEIYQRLEELLDIPAMTIGRKVAAAGFQSPYPIYLKRDVDEKTIAQILEHQSKFPGIGVSQEAVRYYPHGMGAAHVIGYTGEITQEQLETLQAKGYKSGDVIGKAGLERIYDETIRGRNGGTYIEVDAGGRPIRQLQVEEPVQGQHLILTLDYDLQKVAEQHLEGKKGAVIAMDPQTGEILAMASRPVYDPNLFTGTISPKAWAELQAKDHPFHNRALNAYPPGSIFKIITTIAAVEQGVLDKARRFLSTGSYRVGNAVFRDHGHGYGNVGIEQALAYSINTVYYELGVQLGIEPIRQWALALGLGEATDIALPGESKGLIPDRAWKRRVLKEGWYAGDNANTAIGQGYNQVTPLQAVVMAAAAGNGGHVLTPQIVKAIRSVNGQTQPESQRTVRNHAVMKPLTQEITRQGMAAAVRYGTSKNLARPDIVVGAKTGTAEDPPRKDHAWVVALAPMDKPKLAVAVFVENGGWGGSTAGPIAKAVIDQYFGPPPGAGKEEKTSP